MNYLPKHVTVPEACEWLATETGEPWTLARLLEHSLMPWVWLDYNPRFPKIFGNRFEGFLTPMLFYGDVVRLAAVGNGVLLTMIRTPDQPQENILVVPGLRGEIHDLRFLRDNITRLAGKHSKPEGTPGAKVEAAPATNAWRENAKQIGKGILEANKSLTLERIATKTHKEMTSRNAKGEPGMAGRGGRVPTLDTIKRWALTGIKA